MPPCRLGRADDDTKRHMLLLHILRQVNRFLTFLLLRVENSAQTLSTRRILFKCPPNPLDRPPKRSRGDDDDHSALLSAYHHDLEKVSENLKDESVFSGTGMPDMLDSAWLARKAKH